MKRKLPALLLALLLTLLPAGCGEGDVTPLPSGYEPPPVMSPAKLVIGYPVIADQESIQRTQDSADYLESLLAGRGWNVELRLLPVEYDENTGQTHIMQAVEQALAAGTAADGYVVNSNQAVMLLDEGLTRDLSDLLPQAAPALNSKYAYLFQGPVTGLPLAIPQEPVSRRVICYLQKDSARGSPINNIEDILSLLENNNGMKIACQWTDWGYLNLLSVWAMGQGYYPLDYYGLMMGELYAAREDGQCAPVPIEDIPGFDEYFARARALWDAGRLADLSNPNKVAQDGVVGFIGLEQAYIDISFLLTRQKSGEDYLAFPLEGCVTPVQVLSEASATGPGQLAVLAASQRPNELALFVQWVLTDRENYDLVRYGAQGADYRLVGERVEHLNGGQPLTLQEFMGAESATSYYFTNMSLFWDPAMDRFTVYAPENAAELKQSASKATHPLMELLVARKIAEPNRFLFDCYTQYEQTISKRAELLDCKENRPNDGGLNPITVAESLEKLHAMAAETAAVADACREKIALLMMEEP